MIARLAGIVAVAATAPSPPPVTTGVIEGRVVFSGTVPSPTIVFEGGATQHVLYLGEQGGLRYVVAFLPDAAAQADDEVGEATLNQRAFIFQPQVLAVREGQPVRFTNEDGANHNVRSADPEPANRFDAYTGAGQAYTHRFRAGPPGRPVQVTCQVHPWMASWIYVFAHPLFAVTDGAGHFRITEVPAGEHRLGIRHPAGLSKELRVRVEGGKATRVEVQFDSADLGSPALP